MRCGRRSVVGGVMRKGEKALARGKNFLRVSGESRSTIQNEFEDDLCTYVPESKNVNCAVKRIGDSLQQRGGRCCGDISISCDGSRNRFERQKV